MDRIGEQKLWKTRKGRTRWGNNCKYGSKTQSSPHQRHDRVERRGGKKEWMGLKYTAMDLGFGVLVGHIPFILTVLADHPINFMFPCTIHTQSSISANIHRWHGISGSLVETGNVLSIGTGGWGIVHTSLNRATRRGGSNASADQFRDGGPTRSGHRGHRHTGASAAFSTGTGCEDTIKFAEHNEKRWGEGDKGTRRRGWDEE